MANLMLSVAAALFYSVASARLYVSLGHAQRRVSSGNAAPAVAPRHSRRRLTLGLAGVALAFHAWVAVSLTGWPESLRLPFFTALSVVAIGVVLLQLVLCIRQPADYLGLAVYPLSAVALLASQASGQGHAIHGHAIQIHVLLSVLAYAVLSLAAAQAGLVSIQRHFLSRHRPGGFMRALPPLETTERLLFALLTAGFALLTMSLASGFFYLEDMFAQHLAHKTVLACVAWAIFGVLLFGRWRFGWRGRRAVQLTLAGFGVLILAYFGSKLVLELVLQRV